MTPDRDADVDYAKTTLRSEHVMASAAIPVAFRPVHVEAPPKQRGWYIDGGVKLNAPIKPALALGADRVVVVATTPDPAGPHASPVSPGSPDVFDAGTVVMHALLVDRMSDDIRALRRVNTLVSAARGRHAERVPRDSQPVPRPAEAGPHQPDGQRRVLPPLRRDPSAALRPRLARSPRSAARARTTASCSASCSSTASSTGRSSTSGAEHASRALGRTGSPFPWALP